jgi:serine O-acetyltransferase
MRGLIDNASSQEHQIALLWQAVATLSEGRTTSSGSCVPSDAARDESFQAAKLTQLVDR